MNRFGVLNLLIAASLVANVIAVDCEKHPEKIDIKSCCTHDSFISQEVNDKCKSHLEGASNEDEHKGPGGQGGPGGHGGHKHGPPPCYMECVMNETGIVELSDMKVDEAKMKSYFASALKGKPDFIQIAQDGFIKCAERVKEMREMMEKNPPKSPPPGKCKPCANILMHCLDTETLFNCPTSSWKNDDGCNNMRDYMMTCKFSNVKE